MSTFDQLEADVNRAARAVAAAAVESVALSGAATDPARVTIPQRVLTEFDRAKTAYYEEWDRVAKRERLF